MTHPDSDIPPTNPFVSVVIPVYNRASFLRSAIDSVYAQEYQPLETIIIDDGSTDNSAVTASAYPGLRCIRQKHQGVAAARNAGVRDAQGDLIAFLDSDDVWTKDKLLIQVRYLKDNPDVDCVVARMKNFGDAGHDTGTWLADAAFEKNSLCIPTLIARKRVFRRVGLFDTSYEVGEDIDWFLRAKDAGVILAALDEILLLRRIHDSNLSRRPIDEQKEIMSRVVKASVDRKRQLKGREK